MFQWLRSLFSRSCWPKLTKAELCMIRDAEFYNGFNHTGNVRCRTIGGKRIIRVVIVPNVSLGGKDETDYREWQLWAITDDDGKVGIEEITCRNIILSCKALNPFHEKEKEGQEQKVIESDGNEVCSHSKGSGTTETHVGEKECEDQHLRRGDQTQ